MEVIQWANGKRQTWQLTKEEAVHLFSALIHAVIEGAAFAFLDNIEVYIEIIGKEEVTCDNP